VAYERVERPIMGAKAFYGLDDASVLSQAAILLAMASQLRGDAPSLISPATAQAGVAAPEKIPAEDLAALGLPKLPPAPGRVDAQRIRGGLFSRYTLRAEEFLADAEKFLMPTQALADLGERFFRQPAPLAAAELMEGCLKHPHELVRVAAAAAYFDRSSEPDRLVQILAQGTRSADDLVREVAATSLAHISPEHPSLQDLLRGGPAAPTSGAPSHTTILVAGTWAANSPWWKPGGNFFIYVTGVLPPLPRTPPLPPAPPWSAPYAANDYYGWSGGYSDGARALAAQDLVKWVQDPSHNAQNPDVITHSHGGNVAMLSTQAGLGLNIKELVMLSCPVHFPKYAPDFSKLQKIVSVRVHLDLVILADRGGQRFSDPRIQENVLPIWFDHFASHDPQVWTRYGVTAML
jgi:hypothetical protein